MVSAAYYTLTSPLLHTKIIHMKMGYYVYQYPGQGLDVILRNFMRYLGELVIQQSRCDNYCFAMKNFEDIGIMFPFFMRGQLVDDSRVQHLLEYLIVNKTTGSPKHILIIS